METLDLQEAAQFLRMHPESLRCKAKAGFVPGTKLGRRWLFIREDLVDHVRSHYAPQRQEVRATKPLETKPWPSRSSNVARSASGGSASQRQIRREYMNRLGRQTGGRRRSTSTVAGQNSGGR